MKKFYFLLVIAPLVLAGCGGSEEKKEGPVYGGTESHPADQTTQPGRSYGPTKLENNLPELTRAELVSEGGAMRIVAEAADKDGDTVQLKYSWTVNDQLVSDKDTLPGFKNGDRIVATVTPFDGKQDGMPQSWVRQIGNAPPQISQSQPQYDDPNWTYQIVAKDPDGDPLEFKLLKGPSGMSVDPKTGLVTWNTSGSSGKHSATVQVSDGKGGISETTFEVTLSEEEPSQ